jgi:hypothetical protein
LRSTLFYGIANANLGLGELLDFKENESNPDRLPFIKGIADGVGLDLGYGIFSTGKEAIVEHRSIDPFRLSA